MFPKAFHFPTDLVKKKNFMAPFYGWGSTASRLEPLRGGSLLFITKLKIEFYGRAAALSIDLHPPEPLILALLKLNLKSLLLTVSGKEVLEGNYEKRVKSIEF